MLLFIHHTLNHTSIHCHLFCFPIITHCFQSIDKICKSSQQARNNVESKHGKTIKLLAAILTDVDTIDIHQKLCELTTMQTWWLNSFLASARYRQFLLKSGPKLRTFHTRGKCKSPKDDDSDADPEYVPFESKSDSADDSMKWVPLCHCMTKVYNIAKQHCPSKITVTEGQDTKAASIGTSAKHVSKHDQPRLDGDATMSCNGL